MCHAHGLSPPALRSKTPYQPLTLPWRTNCPPSSAPLQLTSPMAILDSLTARQLLDAQAHGVSLDKPRQARQELDRNSTGSTWHQWAHCYRRRQLCTRSGQPHPKGDQAPPQLSGLASRQPRSLSESWCAAASHDRARAKRQKTQKTQRNVSSQVKSRLKSRLKSIHVLS